KPTRVSSMSVRPSLAVGREVVIVVSSRQPPLSASAGGRVIALRPPSRADRGVVIAASGSYGPVLAAVPKFLPAGSRTRPSAVKTRPCRTAIVADTDGHNRRGGPG